MKKKPFDATLPGRLGKMTLTELNAESDQYDVEFAGMNSPTIPNQRPHPRKRRGRPAKKPSERVIRVLVSMEPHLLERADAYAKREGMTRAAFIQSALQTVLNRKKSA